MEKISKENIGYNLFFISSKKAKKSKKYKKVNHSKKISDSIVNLSQNLSIMTNKKNLEPKFNHLFSNSQNFLSKYLGSSSNCNAKKISDNNFNSNKSITNQSNIIIPNVQFTPKFKQLKKIQLDSVEKYNTPNEKHKIKKSRKKCYKKTIESLHKQIKSDYKEILKKQFEKPIKMNDVSRKFKIADDFNEINSKKLLYEKDKCLKRMHLTDKIENEEKNNANIFTLTPISHDESIPIFEKRY